MTHTSEYEDISATVRGRTILSAFRVTVDTRADAIALRAQVADVWRQWTWREYASHAARFASGLRRVGFRRGDRAVLLLHNSPQFYFADMGVLLAGGTPTSIFEASSAEQMQFIASHLEARVAVVEDAAAAARLLGCAGNLPALRHVIVINTSGATPMSDDLLSFDDLLESTPVDIDAAVSAASPEDLLTIVYTSGTTGPPKGVMISHRNACWWMESVFRAFGAGYSAAGKRQLSYLPMAAMAERLATHYLHACKGTEVTTCADIQRLDQLLRAVRPQIFLGVPRVWENLYRAVCESVAHDPQIERSFRRAIGLRRETLLATGDGVAARAAIAPASAHAVAPELGKVRQMLGLDSCEIALSGTAPLPLEVLEFFLTLGVPLSETYGLSESTAITMDVLRCKPGTVGRPIPGCEIRLLPDNEIVLRSGNLFQGYFKAPDKTAEAIDAEGWFHTGDIGRVDDEGYLKIVDRKKELIITSDGKNVSPANIESALKAACPLIAQACVVGDRAPYLVALLALDIRMMSALAKAQGLEGVDPGRAGAHPHIRAEIERAVAQVNARFSEPERIQRFSLLQDNWLPGSDEVTPTMKIRRQEIQRKYAGVIRGMYAEQVAEAP